MTPNTKRFIALGNSFMSNNTKAKRFESGNGYDPIKYELWTNKATAASTKQLGLTELLSAQDKEEIEDYYGCGQMFDYD
jgi:hypothetical protein